MVSPNKIKSAISGRGGLALGCQYVLTIVPPAIFTPGYQIARIADMISSGSTIDLNGTLNLGKDLIRMVGFKEAEHISLLAESASIPGRQLLTTEHRLFGTVRKMPYGVLYEDFTVTFICTNSMVERLFFDLWHQMIMNSGSQYMEFYDNYVGSIIIQKLSNFLPSKVKVSDEPGKEKEVGIEQGSATKIGQALSTWKLIEAYPVSVQAQELNYGDNDYLRLTVQFSYAKWHSIGEKLISLEPNLSWIGDEAAIPGQISGGGTPLGNTPTTPGQTTPGTGGQQGGDQTAPPKTTNPSQGAGGTTPTPEVPPKANPTPSNPPQDTNPPNNGDTGPILV